MNNINSAFIQQQEIFKSQLSDSLQDIVGVYSKEIEKLKHSLIKESQNVKSKDDAVHVLEGELKSIQKEMKVFIQKNEEQEQKIVKLEEISSRCAKEKEKKCINWSQEKIFQMICKK